jgi:hypothetical protein
MATRAHGDSELSDSHGKLTFMRPS